MKLLRLLLLSLVCATAAIPAHAQISVDLQIKRRSFIRYEPILATVTVTNLTGRAITLQDADSQWFGFQITTNPGQRQVPPIDPNYHLDPLELKVGESVKRTVNLNTLFSFGEFGHYQIKSTIYSSDLSKYFTSKATGIEVSEGTKLWQQSVGVPEGSPNAGNLHTMTALSFQGTDKSDLYIRIEDRELGVIYCTHKLGHIIIGQPPQMQLDAANNLYVLQMVMPKVYLLTKISCSGVLISQNNYEAPKATPYFRHLADGTLQIINGRREAAKTPTSATSITTPNLSDRPIGLPSPPKD